MTSITPTVAFVAQEEFKQLKFSQRHDQSPERWSVQFHVAAHPLHFKEKVAQARRHDFLLRADNKASLLGIIAMVRDLMNDGEGESDINKASRHGLGSLEWHRLTTWASDVENLLWKFQPSEKHSNDSLLRIVELLEIFQDSHACLAEVARNAEALLDRWSRAGVFKLNAFSGDNDEADDAKNEYVNQKHNVLLSDEAKGSVVGLELSNAYQSFRQRAAAATIRRYVLTWLRSKPSSSERGAKIDSFGRLTKDLPRKPELAETVLAGGYARETTNKFALARFNNKLSSSNSIAFKKLLQYSKYMALFPVDQALRTVEDVIRRRYLFESRCATKIQAVWRRVRENVQTRRLHQTLEELRLQREREAQTRRKAIREAKRQKTIEAGKPKVKKVLKRSSTARSSINSSLNAKLTATVTDEKSKELTTAQTAAMDSSAKRKTLHSSELPLETSNHRASTRGSTAGEKKSALLSNSQSKQRFSRNGHTSNNGCDDDTTDVEGAWKSFMDSVEMDAHSKPECPNDAQVPPASEDSQISHPTLLAPSPPIKAMWEDWSDDEEEMTSTEEDKTDHPSTLLQPRSPSPSLTNQIQVIVSAEKNDESEAAACPSLEMEMAMPRSNDSQPQKDLIESMTPKADLVESTTPRSNDSRPQVESTEFSTPRNNDSRPQIDSTGSTTPRSNRSRPQTDPGIPVVRPPSSLPFDATLQNHTGPYTGAGQLSLMAPFIDSDRSKKPQVSVVPARKHLYELDFGKNEKTDASFVHVAMLHENDEQEDQNVHQFAGKAQNSSVKASTRQRKVASLRGVIDDREKHTRVRSLRNFENHEAARLSDQNLSADQAFPHANKDLSQPSHFVYKTDGTSLKQKLDLRKVLMKASPLAVLREEEVSNAVDFRGNEIKAWHRSTTEVLAQFPDVHPPLVGRVHSRHKRRTKVNMSPTEEDQIQSTAPLAGKTIEKIANHNDVPLLLRQSPPVTRQQKIKQSLELPEDSGIIDMHSPPEAEKQMWKRGQKLADVATAEIGDRVDSTTKSLNVKEKSVVAGQARPILALTEDDKEDGEGCNRDNFDVDNHSPATPGCDEESESFLDGASIEKEMEGSNGIQHSRNDDFVEEYQRLHLQSRERELSRHRSLLEQFQREEIAAEQAQRSANAKTQRLKHNRESAKALSTTSKVAASKATNAIASHFDLKKSGAAAHVNRRVRVKTRDIKAISFAQLYDDIDDALDEERRAKEESNERDLLVRAQQERDAAFEKLLGQYLGLLQCTPAEVARKLKVSLE